VRGSRVLRIEVKRDRCIVTVQDDDFGRTRTWKILNKAWELTSTPPQAKSDALSLYKVMHLLSTPQLKACGEWFTAFLFCVNFRN